MDRSREVWKALKGSRSIALLTPETPEACLRAYEALTPLGIVLEVALRTPAALPGIRRVLETHPAALILAGTVLTRDQARHAVEAGVAGVVCPDFLPGVVYACVEADLMCVPGGLADCGKQLALKAETYGCSLEALRQERPWQWVYKVFPAIGGGQGLGQRLAAWRATYPGIRYLYTGGVRPENVGALAGKDPGGIFCASALVRNLSDPERMVEDAERWLRALNLADRESETGEPEVGGSVQGSPERESEPPEPAGSPAVVTFGEVMLRLSPPAEGSLERPSTFRAHYGGAEANVAAALAQWAVVARFVSALPENDLAHGALARLKGLGVDTSAVVRSGDRMGLYFLEPRSGKDSAKLLYDRRGSAIAGLHPGEVDWNRVLEGATWFHWTGITPALAPGTAAVLGEGLAAARARGLTVSFDLNYRTALWSTEKARSTLFPLLEGVDVLVGNWGQVAALFPFPASWSSGASVDAPVGESPGAGPGSPVPSSDTCRAMAQDLVERFHPRTVVLTYRVEDPDGVRGWGAFLYQGGELFHSFAPVPDLVDGVGGGDAFSAGLIYGTLSGMGLQATLDFGVAASCLKQGRPGDILQAAVDDVLNLVE